MPSGKMYQFKANKKESKTTFMNVILVPLLLNLIKCLFIGWQQKSTSVIPRNI